MAVIASMRPYQWPKSLIVFAALAFSAGQAWELDEPSTWWPLLWRLGLLFGAWCLVSSATYIVNDLRDRDADQLHPRKRNRPIASGAAPLPAVVAVAAAGAAIGIAGAFAIDMQAGVVVAGYAVVMVAYSFGLKRVAVLDVLLLSAGIVARAVSGALAIDVDVSAWLYVCTSFGAFFVAISKRWAESRQLGADAALHRPALAMYTREMLGQLLVVALAGALLSYSIYTIESDNVPSNGLMAVTIPFVAFAMFRYLLLLDGPRRGDAPDRILFTDPQIIVAVVGFAAAAVTVLVV
jgi:4-hydroxybenzoate polyprenyltransferase